MNKIVKISHVIKKMNYLMIRRKLTLRKFSRLIIYISFNNTIVGKFLYLLINNLMKKKIVLNDTKVNCTEINNLLNTVK
jgi:hypothetical protein